LLEYPLIT